VGCDAAPFLQSSESIFDAMALAIQGLAVCDDDLSVLAWWDARGDALGFERRSEAIAVIASLGAQFACARQGVDRQARTLVVVFSPGISWYGFAVKRCGASAHVLQMNS
jgi:hypothetical protein